MDLKIANNIIRKFTKNGKEYTPQISSDWKFSKDENKIFVSSESLDINIPFGSYEYFIDNYVLNQNFDIKQNILVGSFYITSIGLVTENDYFIAEDMIENFTKKIPTKDLLEYHIYLSDKGKEYLYLGSLSYMTLEDDWEFLQRKILEMETVLYDMGNRRIVKPSSVRLIELKEKLKDNISVNGIIRRNEIISNTKVVYVQLLTKTKTASFYNFNVNRIKTSRYNLEKLEEFLKLENKELRLRKEFKKKNERGERICLF